VSTTCADQRMRLETEINTKFMLKTSNNLKNVVDDPLNSHRFPLEWPLELLVTVSKEQWFDLYRPLFIAYSMIEVLI
jgi:hypothetical protein